MVIQSWDSFISSFRWASGEYVSILGPKGYGKTTLLLELASRRKYVVIFANKVKDRTLSAFIKQHDFQDVQSWNEVGPYDDKIVLWPRFNGLQSFSTQEIEFKRAINGYRDETGIFKQGGWTVAFDEILYLTGRDGLGLDREVRMMYTQGRSNDISILGGSQRPFDVPQLMLNQADHFFYFQVSDYQELDRIARVTGNIADKVKQIVPNLGKYEFMYINRAKRTYMTSKVER